MTIEQIYKLAKDFIALVESQNPPKEEEIKETKPKKPKVSKPKKVEVEEIEEVEETEDTESEDFEDFGLDDEEEAAPEITQKDIMLAFKEFVKKKSTQKGYTIKKAREEAKAILTKHKAKSVESLKPELYEKVMAILSK
jgi:hypothetical protein